VICSLAVAGGFLLAATNGLQNAVANGDTRSLSLVHLNSHESLTVTYRRDGRYDRDGLKQLNHFLRDWRTQDETTMDPKLFDILWAVERESGSRGPIQVLSAYRSPNTNAMLRRRSHAVAEHSQHMLGKAIDFNLPDVPMNKVRAIGMRLQHGGVGYYPNVPFVHLDTGSVRAWPRMPRVELARLFPDGRTVHIPADGRPLPGYEEAKAQILARGDAVGGERYAVADNSSGGGRSFFARLFGGRSNDATPAPAPASGSAVVADARSGDDAGTRGMFVKAAGGRNTPAAETRPAQGAPVVASLADAAPVPLPVARPADLRPAMAQAPAETAPAVAALVPLPPPRPNESRVAALADVPIPPVRPALASVPQPAPEAAPLVASAATLSQGAKDALAALTTASIQPKRNLAPAAPVVAAMAYGPLGRSEPPNRPAPTQQAQAAASGPPQQQSPQNPLQPLFRAEATSVRPKQQPNVVVAQPRLVAVADRPVAQKPRLVVASTFAGNPSYDLSFGAFTGPAVKPVPTVQFSAN
jgi:uncharacterized protein YcbK (DUF882 family)